MGPGDRVWDFWKTAPALPGERWCRRGRYVERDGARVWVSGETRTVCDVSLGRDVLYYRGRDNLTTRCSGAEWAAWKATARQIAKGKPV